MYDLAIIIVSWNTKKLIKDCLLSIKSSIHHTSYKVFVVDNNSSDGTVQMLRSEFNDINIIANKTNEGFAKANNEAIKISDSKYVMLLNPDTIVKDNALDIMVDYMEKNKEVGITGCKLFNKDGSLQESCRRFPDIKTYSCILLKLHTLFPNMKCLKNYFMKDMDYDKINEVDQVMGAALMFRSNVLGGKSFLDEDYWIWFEEVDFCYKVKKKGYKIVYIPNANIIHYKAQSFSQLLKVKQQKIFNKSLLVYFNKNGKKYETVILRILFPLSILLSFFLQTMKAIKRKDN